jgi:lincosamide nucleotidyltransferase A/C/D/E
MTAAEVVAVIDRLEGGGVDVWVDGGWGIDALLGRQTRPHGDIDLVIGWSDLRCAERALAPLGFTHDTDAAPGLPARFVLRDAEGRQVDVHPVEFDASGHGWQDLGDGRRGRYAAAGLTGVGRIAGRAVRCLTAELQLAHHCGYELPPHERRDLALLAESFGLD